MKFITNKLCIDCYHVAYPISEKDKNKSFCMIGLFISKDVPNCKCKVTKEQYNEKFQKWLKTKNKLTLQEYLTG